MDDKAHLEWLETTLKNYEKELAEAEDTVARLRPLIENLRGVLAALLKNNHAERPRYESVQSNKQGNRGKRVGGGPLRRLAYSNLAMWEAIQRYLNNSPGKHHADEIARAIFEVKTETDLSTVKPRVVTELSKGKEKGLWRFHGKNVYERLN